jgi:hypothetical protein
LRYFTFLRAINVGGHIVKTVHFAGNEHHPKDGREISLIDHRKSIQRAVVEQEFDLEWTCR